jgi:hypothetical protein
MSLHPIIPMHSRRSATAVLVMGPLVVGGVLKGIGTGPVVSTEDFPMATALRPRPDASSLEIDEALERPEPFADIDTANPQAVLDRIHQQLTQAGFSTTSIDKSEGTMLLLRRLPKDEEEYVRVWLARSFVEPDKHASIYVRYARTVAVIGSGPRRRLTSKSMGSDLESLLNKAID